MPALASPVTDERDALREFVAYHQSTYFAIAYGLTDEQARSTPSASALSIGGLIKHATGMQRTWMLRVAAAPEPPTPDARPFEERRGAFAEEFLMRDDETLQQLLDAFAAQNADTLRQLDAADLDTPVPVPTDAPWFPTDVEQWSARGCSTTSSTSSRVTRATGTLFASRSTARRCTNWSPGKKAGRRRTGSSRGASHEPQLSLRLE